MKHVNKIFLLLALLGCDLNAQSSIQGSSFRGGTLGDGAWADLKALGVIDVWDANYGVVTGAGGTNVVAWHGINGTVWNQYVQTNQPYFDHNFQGVGNTGLPAVVFLNGANGHCFMQNANMPSMVSNQAAVSCIMVVNRIGFGGAAGGRMLTFGSSQATNVLQNVLSFQSGSSVNACRFTRMSTTNSVNSSFQKTVGVSTGAWEILGFLYGAAGSGRIANSALASAQNTTSLDSGPASFDNVALGLHIWTNTVYDSPISIAVNQVILTTNATSMTLGAWTNAMRSINSKFTPNLFTP